MQQHRQFTARDLRLAFDDAVISLPLAAHATLADIAQLWEDVAATRQRTPVDIKIIFADVDR